MMIVPWHQPGTAASFTMAMQINLSIAAAANTCTVNCLSCIQLQQAECLLILAALSG